MTDTPSKAPSKRHSDADFRAHLAETVSPYGDGDAARKIKTILKQAELEGIVVKRFFDLPSAAALTPNRKSLESHLARARGAATANWSRMTVRTHGTHSWWALTAR